MNEIKAIIFDCDGVMFESRQANLAYYNQIIAQFAHPPILPEHEELAHLCHTASSSVVLKTLLGEENFAAAHEYSVTLDYRKFIPLMIQEPSLVEVLDRLSQCYPLAVATNRGYSIKTILNDFSLSDYFSSVVTCHDVAAPKPAPDMLLLVAQQLELLPYQCLFVGDSILDRQAADKAKMEFIGYGDSLPGKVNIDNLAELFPYLHISD